MELPANNFNPATVDGLMCLSTINIACGGEVLDCDFNQMLHLRQRATGQPLHLRKPPPDSMARQPILTGKHCFGCTAGHDSSCTCALEPALAACFQGIPHPRAEPTGLSAFCLSKPGRSRLSSVSTDPA